MADAPGKGAEKLSMRSRMAWAIFVLLVVLIVIVLMRFDLTALHGPGRAETRLTNLPKRFFIYRASRRGILRPPGTPKPVLKEVVHTTDWIAEYVMPTMAGHNARRGRGCTHAHRISQASKCRATPTRSCFGSSRMESASPECRLLVASRPRSAFGIS